MNTREKMNEFKEHDIVVLKNDIKGISKGTKGVIVFEYHYDFGRTKSGVFEVEFFDDEFNTIRTERISKDDLEKE